MPFLPSAWIPAQASEGGYAGDLTPQLFMWGDIDMYIPLEKPNT